MIEKTTNYYTKKRSNTVKIIGQYAQPKSALFRKKDNIYILKKRLENMREELLYLELIGLRAVFDRFWKT